MDTDKFTLNNVPCHKDTHFYIACSNGDLETVKLLINKEADGAMSSVTRTLISATDDGGFTPLHVACYNSTRAVNMHKYLEIVRLLIEVGAEVSTLNNSGYSPLHHVCINNNTKMLELLLKGGAEISTVNKYGFTLLHNACINGKERSARVKDTCRNS